MRNDLADVTVVVDRSGSMAKVEKEASEGVNSFIKKQKEQPGECTFSLVQFDTEYEFVHKGVPIKNVPEDYRLSPRGWTALLDAVGRGIKEAGDRLSKMEESQRPGLVVFVIVTDGHENSSKEFNRNQIKKMIKVQREVYKWQFTFLGANQDAFAEASNIGIQLTAAANYKEEKTCAAFHASGNNVARMRVATSSGVAPDNNYTDAERKAMS